MGNTLWGKLLSNGFPMLESLIVVHCLSYNERTKKVINTPTGNLCGACQDRTPYNVVTSFCQHVGSRIGMRADAFSGNKDLSEREASFVTCTHGERQQVEEQDAAAAMDKQLFMASKAIDKYLLLSFSFFRAACLILPFFLVLVIIFCSDADVPALRHRRIRPPLL
mmetsp:Transcript_37372/g.111971  ORF Transcript_37372/g.111971 Transcript_37372/m.111971 type:complete len:166 (+) Transcript_37372:69-566(+)